MKHSFIVSFLAVCSEAVTHNVVVMGSSYAYGYGLTGDNPSGTNINEVQNYGYKLAQKLGTLNSDSFVHNLAQSGSLLDYVQSQASNIPPGTTVIALTSGGNDLNYIGCLGVSSCVSPPSGMTEVRSLTFTLLTLTTLRQFGKLDSCLLSRLSWIL